MLCYDVLCCAVPCRAVLRCVHVLPLRLLAPGSRGVKRLLPHAVSAPGQARVAACRPGGGAGTVKACEWRRVSAHRKCCSCGRQPHARQLGRSKLLAGQPATVTPQLPLFRPLLSPHLCTAAPPLPQPQTLHHAAPLDGTAAPSAPRPAAARPPPAAARPAGRLPAPPTARLHSAAP